jgi:hypothetical protein
MKRCPRKGCKADMSALRSDAVWCSRKCYIAVRRDPRAYRAPTTIARPGGRQVSYRKAVDVLTADFVAYGNNPDVVRAYFERVLARALPERQR